MTYYYLIKILLYYLLNKYHLFTPLKKMMAELQRKQELRRVANLTPEERAAEELKRNPV